MLQLKGLQGLSVGQKVTGLGKILGELEGTTRAALRR
jgi:hypothetical protein